METQTPKEYAEAQLGRLLVGKYRLLSVLGVGGMGSVFLAVHEFTDRKVALKVMHPQLARGVNVQRFLREAKASAQIQHPRVAQVLDAGEDPEDGLYLAMEYLEGEDLGQHIRRGRLSSQVVTQVGLQALEALEVAHGRGFVHRDIKPGNLLLVTGPAEVVDTRVLDFGVARRAAPSQARLTQAGHVVGTPYFMSPEQMCGEEVDGRADLWGLGVVMYYALSRTLPFSNASYVDLLGDMLRTGAAPVNVHVPEVHSGLAAVLQTALAPRIEDRYPDAAQMRAALVALEVTPRPLRVPDPVPAGPRGDKSTPPPAWAPPLEALEAEIQALEAKRPVAAPEPPRTWWPFGKKGK